MYEHVLNFQFALTFEAALASHVHLLSTIDFVLVCATFTESSWNVSTSVLES